MQKLNICAFTRFGHLLSLQSQAAYHKSVNGKSLYISVLQQSFDVRLLLQILEITLQILKRKMQECKKAVF
jgi:hypothetical protein